MKSFNLLCGTILLAASGASAQTYLSCDFNNGIPPNFTLIDNDKNEHTDDAKEIGFAVGTAWIATIPPKDDSKAACATSWNENGGTSDDWMITPAFTVADDNVTAMWRTRSHSKRIKESYSVYVSETGGNTIADFDLENPLITVNGENFTWTYYNESLDAYKGKTISLAFVNHSTDKGCIYLDDLSVGTYSPLQITCTVEENTPYGGNVKFTGILKNHSSDYIDEYTITLNSYNDEIVMEMDSPINPGEELAFEMDKPIYFGFNETRPYKMSVTCKGATHSVEGEITSYQRRVLCEELTGTWCMYCVRGIAMLERIRDMYKDVAIGVAVHQGDPMENSILSTLQKNFVWEGYPNGIVGRKYSNIPPEYFPDGINAVMLEEPVKVAMEPSVSVDFETNTVVASTKFIFADKHDAADYNISYVIIENNVHHPNEQGYEQANSWGGQGKDTMDGWGLLPFEIPSEVMWYHDVARYIEGDLHGIEGLVPEKINSREEFSVEHTFTVPSSRIDDLHNCELVVLLLDGKDNRSINVNKVALDENAPEIVDVVARYTGVEDITVDDAKVIATDYYDLLGRKVENPGNGIFIRSETLSNGSIKSSKIIKN